MITITLSIGDIVLLFLLIAVLIYFILDFDKFKTKKFLEYLNAEKKDTETFRKKYNIRQKQITILQHKLSLNPEEISKIPKGIRESIEELVIPINEDNL